MGVPSTGRIRSQPTFQSLRRPAGRARSGVVRAAFVAPDQSSTDAFPLVAYTIGRRCGPAVRRNRIRRRLRSAVTIVSAELPPGSYLVGADPDAHALPFPQLVAAVSEAMTLAARRGLGGKP
jgi:ribonuclease P protein component